MSIYQINGGSNYTISKCECMSIRYCIKLAKSSGLEKLLKTCTFKTYKADTEWQTIVKDKAAEYLNQFEENKWFYIGGQSGAGKTHICTAICRKLLAKNIPVRYMLWRDTLSELMRNMNNSEEYEKIIKPLKECRVLYIDDLFKNQKNEAPSPWEVKLAFEIINYRAIDDSLVTIISSEKLLHEIIYEIDEAIGGRIRQRAGGKDSYVISISNNRDKNYRLAD